MVSRGPTSKLQYIILNLNEIPSRSLCIFVRQAKGGAPNSLILIQKLIRPPTLPRVSSRASCKPLQTNFMQKCLEICNYMKMYVNFILNVWITFNLVRAPWNSGIWLRCSKWTQKEKSLWFIWKKYIWCIYDSMYKIVQNKMILSIKI